MLNHSLTNNHSEHVDGILDVNFKKTNKKLAQFLFVMFKDVIFQRTSQ